MLKNLIAPVQAWLLTQGKCVGCGTPIASAKKNGKKLICKCGRMYVEENGKYRRARFEEV